MQSQLPLPTKEEILTTWSRAYLREKKLIPKVAGIYVLVSNREFVYIGTSRCLRKRICGNMTDHPITWLFPEPENYIGFTRFQEVIDYLDLEYKLEVYWWLMNNSEISRRYKLESALIKQFKPPLNKR